MQFLHTTKQIEIIGAMLSKDTCLVARQRKPQSLQRLALGNPRTVAPTQNFLWQAHNIQINTMQQLIVMNEYMNRRNEEILRVLAQESPKTELRIK
jgi:hypothetical protein